MVRITEDLIRKKAEHHDDILTTLEELTLHQLEIERIEPVLGSVCRKLRILYLQNNIIPRMEHLHHLKDLRYLNMGLNNVTRIEGIANCEFLNKLDLIVNFIDLDELEASVEHLRPLLHLRELFLMGNPCTEWAPWRAFVVGSLPQLQTLDGTEVSRTERIQSQQQLRGLRAELRVLAAAKREEKGLPRVEEPPPEEDEEGGDDDAEPWSPEARVRMYREMAEQKEEKERARRANEPRERNYDKEHAEAVAAVRAKELAGGAGSVRQCNEGRWDFVLEDEDGKGNCVLRLGISRFLDSSLADVDVHPSYVSVVVKGKLFRVLWPDEVRADAAACQRSQATGELVVTAPKVKEPSRALLELKRREREEALESGDAGAGSSGLRVAVASAGARGAAARRKAAAAAAAGRPRVGAAKLADEMSAAVRLAGIVPASRGGVAPEAAAPAARGTVGDGQGGSAVFRAASSSARRPAAAEAAEAARAAAAAQAAGVDEDEVPPLE